MYDLKIDHTYSTVDIFKTFDTDKLKGKTKGKIARKYKCRDKSALAQKIFLKFMFLMLTDLCTSSNMFQFPTRYTCYFKMMKIKGDKFKLFRKRGAFKDIDFLMSDFCGYIPVMEYEYASGQRRYDMVSVSQQFKDLIIEKTNSGFKYS